ncbi:hypothetical protein QZH41_006921 [Actinostola sp. cb2023]|nr:hypothetical protein QZH41_006921 [Actinostola sp. cb2023]
MTCEDDLKECIPNGKVDTLYVVSPKSKARKDGFVASPLNTVPKRDSSERRVIVDLSWPCGSSVNDGIPSDYFLGESLHLEYPTIDVIVDAVIATGPRFLTMGLRSAAMACQRSTSAVSWIFQQRGHSLFNYLDDFIGVSLPSTASENFIEPGELLHDLGLEESPEKASSSSTVTVCLRVELDTLAFTLSQIRSIFSQKAILILPMLDLPKPREQLKHGAEERGVAQENEVPEEKPEDVN